MMTGLAPLGANADFGYPSPARANNIGNRRSENETAASFARNRALIIDSTHRRWILTTLALSVVSTALYFWLDRNTPGGLTGGSTVGLWYGIAGSALMVYAGLLSALRRVPSWWWVGARKVWLRGHVWLGLLSGVLVACHSGFRWGGPLEQLLWAVLLGTLLTGVVGVVLQQFLPRMITSRVPGEAPFEAIPHLCRSLRTQADDLIKAVWTAAMPDSQKSVMASQAGIGARVQLQEFFEKHVRPYLAHPLPPRSLLADALRTEATFSRFRAMPGLAAQADELHQLEALCEERRQLAEQERLHYWLHGWLLLHVPLSVALLVLGIAHAVTALYH